MTDQPEPPIRLVLAALFMAARLIGNADAPRQIMIKDAVDDADELLRQVPL
jgi:hypothetical protein